MSSEDISRYYQLCNNILNYLPDYKFRHFRVHRIDGRFAKLKIKVKSVLDLQNWLVENIPLSVYYSVGLFRRPWMVGSRNSDDAGFMGMDLVFDIDEPQNLAQGLEEAKKILNFGQRSGWKLKYMAFSGSKGFHVVFQDPFYYHAVKSNELEGEAISVRKKLVEDMLEEGIKFDTKVTVDSRRIIRLPLSIHYKTGMLCQPLNVDDAMNMSMSEIQNAYFKQVVSPVLPHAGISLLNPVRRIYSYLTKKYGIFNALTNSYRKIKNRRRESFFFTTFMSNKVVGTSLFIPIIEYSFFNNSSRKLLQKVIQTYRLGCVHVFSFGSERYYALGMRPVQKRRLEKILKSAHSSNFGRFLQYGRVDMEIGPRVDKRNNPVGELIYLESLGLPEKDVSRGHTLFFGLKGDILVGKEHVELIYKIIRVTE